MNILFITPSAKTGGGNRVFIELANQLCREHEISVIYPNNSPEKHTFTVDPAVRFLSIGKPASGKIAKLCNILRTIRYVNRQDRDNYVIFSDPLFALFATLLRAKRSFRFIQADDYRIFDDGAILGKGILLKVYKKLCLIGYRNRRIRFIFNSRFVYDQFCRDAHRGDVPYQLVHPAISAEVFTPEGRSPANNNICLVARKHPGKGRSPANNNICLVARKHPGKGLITFLNVYYSLPDEYRQRTGDIFLISHDDLSAFDLSGMNVIRPCADTEIAETYRKADIFISTSWWEGFGLPPLEAMSCGCACIVSESGGVNEYIIPGKNSLSFPPKDEPTLRARLITLLDDHELRESIKKQGMATASKFSWGKTAGQLISILKNY